MEESISLKHTKTLLFLIMIAGALFRLAAPDLTELWGSDERREYHQVMRMLNGEDFPVNSPVVFPYGTQGHLPGGFYYYLLAIPYAISSHPAAGTVFLNILNVIAIALVFLLGRRMLSTKAGLLGALFFAFSPWSFFQGRKFMCHYTGAFFALLFLLALWRWIAEDDARMALITFPLMALILQIHLVFLPLCLFFVFAIAFFRPKVHVGLLAGGVLLAIATYAPFIIVDAREGFPVIRAFFAFSEYSGQAGGFRPDALKSILHPLIMTTGEVSYFTRHETLSLYGLPTPFFLAVALSIITVVVALFSSYGAGFALLLRTLRRKGRSALQGEARAFTFLFAFVIFFVVVNLLRGAVAHPKYFVPVLPVQCIFVAYFFTHVLVAAKDGVLTRIRPFARVLIALVVIVHAALIGRVLFAWERGTVFSGMSKTPLRYELTVCEYILATSGSNYVILDEVPEVWSEHLGAVYPYTTYMIDYYGVTPATNADTSYYRLYKDEGTPPPHALYTNAVAQRRFANIHVFRVMSGER